MLFRSRGGGGGVGSSEETGERQRNREHQMRSPLADRNERIISKTTGKDESEKERGEREFAGVKKKQNEAKKTTTKTTASVSVCPDIIREYRETTSTRSLTENEIQINSRDDALNSVGEEEEALKKTKISMILDVNELEASMETKPRCERAPNSRQDHLYCPRILISQI